MTYSYNEYGCNKSYYGLHMAKWVVYDCDQSMFLDCIDKKLTLANIFFDRYFNQPVEVIHHFTSFSKLLLVAILIDPLKALANCTNLRQITFGRQFNKSIANCTTLRQITFSHYSEFSQLIKALPKHIRIIKL